MKMARAIALIGILMSAFLAIVWILDLAPDQEFKKVIGQVAGVIAVISVTTALVSLLGKPSSKGQ